MTEEQNFLRIEMPKLLEQLQEDTPAKWGLMGPQHAVEHLSSIMYISLGKKAFPIVIPEEKIPKAKAWLRSDKIFRREVKMPGVLPVDAPSPLRFGSLDEAKSKLLQTLEAFYQRYEQDPEAEANHPAFGSLDQELWERFHYKHFVHHFRQFGLLPLPEEA